MPGWGLFSPRWGVLTPLGGWLWWWWWGGGVSPQKRGFFIPNGGVRGGFTSKRSFFTYGYSPPPPGGAVWGVFSLLLGGGLISASDVTKCLWQSCTRSDDEQQGGRLRDSYCLRIFHTFSKENCHVHIAWLCKRGIMPQLPVKCCDDAPWD